jgi:hypothetical protein
MCSVYTQYRLKEPFAVVDFKEILDNLPDKTPRSRLEPYRELIVEMRRLRRPLREIAQVLGEKCGISVVPSTIHDFLNADLRRERKDESHALEKVAGLKPARRNKSLSDSSKAEEVEQRIAALKARKPEGLTMPERFRFVSGEPLRLEPKQQRPGGRERS